MTVSRARRPRSRWGGSACNCARLLRRRPPRYVLSLPEMGVPALLARYDGDRRDNPRLLARLDPPRHPRNAANRQRTLLQPRAQVWRPRRADTTNSPERELSRRRSCTSVCMADAEWQFTFRSRWQKWRARAISIAASATRVTPAISPVTQVRAITFFFFVENCEETPGEPREPGECSARQTYGRRARVRRGDAETDRGARDAAVRRRREAANDHRCGRPLPSGDRPPNVHRQRRAPLRNSRGRPPRAH